MCASVHVEDPMCAYVHVKDPTRASWEGDGNAEREDRRFEAKPLHRSADQLRAGQASLFSRDGGALV